jgi:phage shock protein A
MIGQLILVKNHLAEGQRQEARLAERVEICAREASAWEQRARSAMRAGDDVVAKDALMRKREHQRNAEELRVLQQRQRQEVENMTRALVSLETASKVPGANKPLAKTSPRQENSPALAPLPAAVSGLPRTKR